MARASAIWPFYPDDFMKILVFGNRLVKRDSLALRVANRLDAELRGKGIEFHEFDAAENLEDEGPDITLLDVAGGIKKVTVLTDVDLDKLEKPPSYSMHDFDLAITLKLLKKIGKIKSVRIIAIPIDHEEKKAVEEVRNVLSSKPNLL